MNLSEFLHMGGYAFYVWTSFGLTAAILIANLALPLRERRQLLDQLKRRARAQRGDA